MQCVDLTGDVLSSTMLILRLSLMGSLLMGKPVWQPYLKKECSSLNCLSYFTPQSQTFRRCFRIPCISKGDFGDTAASVHNVCIIVLHRVIITWLIS